MTRIQLACFSLVASAFLLAGLLVVQLGDRHDAGLTSQAYGGQVIARENFTLLTARARTEEEALFVLENSSAMLLVYRLDTGRNELVLAAAQDMNQIFQEGAGGNGGDQNRAPRRGR
ncbi:hypothetical protein ACERK3_09620 [Phycisphaerales bacterium AB-hyl4]|uniref:Flagellar protein FliO/FliZ n=1 Tax=Natronomicrosphaera hydrolytica TaxID=3242702 RepID=A0ABV4U8E5_9BACT